MFFVTVFTKRKLLANWGHHNVCHTELITGNITKNLMPVKQTAKKVLTKL